MFINSPPGTYEPDDQAQLPENPPANGHSTNNDSTDYNEPPIENEQSGTNGQSSPCSEAIPSPWREHQIVVAGQPQTVLLCAGPEDDAIDALNRRPRLVYQQSGAPNLSLSLILKRMPLGHETNIHPLVHRSILTLDMQMGLPPPPILEVLKDDLNATEEPREVRRLFARHIVYAVQWDRKETVLASVEAGGMDGQAGLTLHLNQAQTLDVLSALHGTPSDFKICATIDYRQSSALVDIRLLGSWAEAHDYLQPHVDADGRINSAQLHQLILEMVQAHVLQVTMGETDRDTHQVSMDNLPKEELVRAFMLQSVVILRKSGADEDFVAQWYTLRHRPHPSFTLDITFRSSGQTMKRLTLVSALEELLGGALNGLPWDDFVHLFAEDGEAPDAANRVNRFAGAEHVRRVPRRSADQTKRSTAEPQSESERGIPSNNLVQMALVENRLQSISSVTQLALFRVRSTQEVALTTLQPTLQMRPAQIKTAIVSPQVFHSEIIIAHPDKDKLQNLPIVSTSKERYWPDRANRKRYWYAPVLEVVQPRANVEASQSPFLFTFERIGTLTSGQPALCGTIKLTLQPSMDTATKQVLGKARITTAQAVPLANVGVTLLIPFIDQNGQSKQHACVATVEKKGATLVATINLINEWVRLGYGALARQGFQHRPAELAIAYGFESYIPVRKKDIRLTFGGKAILLPIAFSESQSHQLQGGTFFDAHNLTLHNPRFEIKLRPETIGGIPGRSLSNKAESDVLNLNDPRRTSPILHTYIMVMIQRMKHRAGR